MLAKKNLGVFISVRTDVKTRTAFQRKAFRYGRPSDVLRELIDAFIDDRLIIQPDPKRKSLYVTRTEN